MKATYLRKVKTGIGIFINSIGPRYYMLFMSIVSSAFRRIFSFTTIGKEEKLRASSYYRSRLSRISSWEKLYAIYTIRQESDFNSTRDIGFRNVPFGSKSKQVRRLLGEPRHIINNTSAIQGHMVFFYKYNFAGILTKCEVHFLNDTFFLSTYAFYRTLDGKSTEVKEVLFSKYLDPKVKVDFDATLRINDQKGNSILLEKDVELMITYISGEKNIMEAIAGHIKQNEISLAKEENKRMHLLSEVL